MKEPVTTEPIYTKDKTAFILNKKDFDTMVFWRFSTIKGKVELMIAGRSKDVKRLIEQLPD